MDHFRNLMGLVESACETEVSSGRTRATWYWWEIDLNLESLTRIQEFFNAEEPNRCTTLM